VGVAGVVVAAAAAASAGGGREEEVSLGVIITNTEIKFHILLPPKTRYKQKQNEIHYENSTHFIRLTLSKVETPPLAVLHTTSENTVGINHYMAI
jgi:hypothetical protein